MGPGTTEDAMVRKGEAQHVSDQLRIFVAPSALGSVKVQLKF